LREEMQASMIAQLRLSLLPSRRRTVSDCLEELMKKKSSTLCDGEMKVFNS
jgi:hypothetical protein